MLVDSLQAYARAVRVHGELGLSFELFRRRIEEIPCQHSADLYLALSCAEGFDAAWTRFDHLYRDQIIHRAASTCHSWLEGRELGLSVMTDLYLPTRTGLRRISLFNGLSTLSTWLRAVVLRSALNARRGRLRDWQPMELASQIQDYRPLSEIENSIRTARYAAIAEEALAAAVCVLSPLDRTLLVDRYVRRLSIGSLADSLCVRASTVVRRFERIHRDLRAYTLQELQRVHGLDPAQIIECVAALSQGRCVFFLSMLEKLSASMQFLPDDVSIQRQQILGPARTAGLSKVTTVLKGE
jgi:RNA polymerase sigma factor (sigma-70 family)